MGSRRSVRVCQASPLSAGGCSGRQLARRPIAGLPFLVRMPSTVGRAPGYVSALAHREECMGGVDELVDAVREGGFRNAFWMRR